MYLRARYYEPRTGRFTSEDVAKDGINWYTYCGSNPARYVDPSGKTLIESFDAFGAGRANAAVNSIVGLYNATINFTPSGIVSHIFGIDPTISINAINAFFQRDVKDLNAYYFGYGYGTLEMLLIGAGLGMGAGGAVTGAGAISSISSGGSAVLSGAVAGELAGAAVAGGSVSAGIMLSKGGSDSANYDYNWQLTKERYLEKKLMEEYGIDPHDIKIEVLGKRANLKLYDIYADKNTGQLAVFRKGGKELVEITDYYIK